MSRHQELNQSFNKHWLDIQDPTEDKGLGLPIFSLNNLFQTNGERTEIIAQACYERVVQRMSAENMGEGINFKVINYSDDRYRDEPPRKYIVIERETNRRTLITILVRFLTYRENLYAGLDSYVVGELDRKAVAWRIAVTLLPFLFTFFNVLLAYAGGAFNSFLSGRGPNFLELWVTSFWQTFFYCMIPWGVVVIPLFWTRVIRIYLANPENGVSVALRVAYSKPMNTDSFNVDDVLITLKSALPLILVSVRDVFEEHDVSVETIDDFIAQVRNVNNIQNIYGSYNTVAGSSGTASSTISQAKSD